MRTQQLLLQSRGRGWCLSSSYIIVHASWCEQKQVHLRVSLFQYCLNLSGSFQTAEKVLQAGKGNVFSHVCLSICSQEEVVGEGGRDRFYVVGSVM